MEALQSEMRTSIFKIQKAFWKVEGIFYLKAQFIMTVVHQPRTTFSPGNFIVSFLLHGITILGYSFPEEDYFSVSNFASSSFLGQSLQICIAMKQGSFPGIAGCREKSDVCSTISVSAHLLLVMNVCTLGCTHPRIRVSCNETWNQEKLGGFWVSL